MCEAASECCQQQPGRVLKMCKLSQCYNPDCEGTSASDAINAGVLATDSACGQPVLPMAAWPCAQQQPMTKEPRTQTCIWSSKAVNAAHGKGSVADDMHWSSEYSRFCCQQYAAGF
jgi:hypothetical protein